MVMNLQHCQEVQGWLFVDLLVHHLNVFITYIPQPSSVFFWFDEKPRRIGNPFTY